LYGCVRSGGLRRVRTTADRQGHKVRFFRIFLPADYNKSYPVLYFFHGWSERYNRISEEIGNYDDGTGCGGENYPPPL
jgi:hypothetical protein